MRSRIAITLMLVLGFGFSSAGAGMAITGVATQDTSASDAQYAEPNKGEKPTLAPTAPPVTEVEGETDEGAPPVKSDNDVAGVQDEAPVTQETRQLAAEQGDDELPFTGFAAIPVLLLGLALLSTGFVLRRRA